MASRRPRSFRYLILAVLIAMVLWSVAHSSSSVERGYDIPVAFEGLPEDLVITDQSSDEVNIRVRGSRAALRNLSPTQMEYVVQLDGAKSGGTIHSVEVSQLEEDFSRGLRIVSRSPAQIDLRLEPRGRKNVRVRLDLQGEPAEGFALGEVELEPARVWLTGARSRVLRVSEAVTEAIDVSGAEGPIEREVRLSLGSDHVWMEEDEPITVRIPVAAVPEVAGAAEGEEGGA